MAASFEFTKKALEKTIYIKLNGRFQQNSGMDYINQYNSIVKSINPEEYTLRFDCTNLDVTPNDSVDMLQDCFNMYAKSNFKKVTAVLNQKQSVLSMQFNRLARNAKLNTFEIEK